MVAEAEEIVEKWPSFARSESWKEVQFSMKIMYAAPLDYQYACP